MVKFKTALFATILLFSTFTSAAARNAIIQGYDLITYPRAEVTLEVKVERARLFPTRLDLKGQRIEFYRGETLIGAAISGRDGLAKIKVSFETVGTKVIKAVLSSGLYKANITDNRVLVIKRDSPLLVTDIDHTISDISARDFLITPDTKIPTLLRASEIVNRLSKKFNILYLTARDDAFIKRTKFWLDFNQFPVAPTFFWDFGFWNGVPSNHGEYKSQVLRKVMKTHRNLLIGVGDKPHDAEAYRANGLRAYYVGPPGYKLPRHTIYLKTWEAIEKHINTNPIGTLPGDPRPLFVGRKKL